MVRLQRSTFEILESRGSIFRTVSPGTVPSIHSGTIGRGFGALEVRRKGARVHEAGGGYRLRCKSA